MHPVATGRDGVHQNGGLVLLVHPVATGRDGVHQKRRQRACQFGARFSTNAFGPSLASSVAKIVRESSASMP